MRLAVTVLALSALLQPNLPSQCGVPFESEQDMVEGMSTPEGQELRAALLKDEGNFVDHSKSTAFLVQEHEL